MGITNRQSQVLKFIDNYITGNNESPSFRDIANALGVSVGAVQDIIGALQKKNLILTVPNRRRSIKVLDPKSAHLFVSLPLLGTISAGEGITIYEEPDPGLIKVPANMVSSNFGNYCLRVAGFSMAEDGILDGDIVVVRQQSAAIDGDTVVAAIKSETTEERATLKKFYRRGNKIELRPRNQTMSSRFFRPEEIEVRGKFCGLIRTSESYE